MQCEYAFVGICLERKNTKKKIIGKKIKMKTKLTDNILPVITPLQHYQVLLCYLIQELFFVLTQDLKS